MNEHGLMVFGFEGREVRVVVKDGEPWWVLSDVAKVLGYRDAYNAGRLVKEHQRDTHPVSTPGGVQPMLCVNEGGLNRLIMRSDLEEAEHFQDWVCEEVIPSIRKNGMYVTEALLDNPEHLLQVTQRLVEERRARLEEQRARLAAEAKVKELAPKADFHDAVAVAENCQSVADVAKLLGTGEIRFFEWLRTTKILMSRPRNRPYQQYLDDGYFRVRSTSYTKSDGSTHTSITPLFTGKGFTWVQKRWAQAGNTVQIRLEASSSDRHLLQ